MQIVTQKIAPCLWFDSEAEEAAKFYVSVFKNSKINTVSRRRPGDPRQAGWLGDGRRF
jgi:predicted 3-demethylubiquinone-9 3-methyltransferase (glyoxalase superfamily)